jgi:hypothetical protein
MGSVQLPAHQLLFAQRLWTQVNGNVSESKKLWTRFCGSSEALEGRGLHLVKELELVTCRLLTNVSSGK